jgi:hypothetical protein
MVMMCIIANEQRERFAHSKATPQRMTAAQLVTKGPGDNWHIILTEYVLRDPQLHSKVTKQIEADIVPKGGYAAGQQIITLLKSVDSKEEAEKFLAKKSIEGYYRRTGNTLFFDASEGPPTDYGMGLWQAAGFFLVSGVALVYFGEKRRQTNVGRA